MRPYRGGMPLAWTPCMRTPALAFVLVLPLFSACMSVGGRRGGKGDLISNRGGGAAPGSASASGNAGMLIISSAGGAPTFQPTPPSCGDGKLTEDEACDDGNTTDGDGCSANCLSVEAGYSCSPAG